jgi:hypothetical protein
MEAQFQKRSKAYLGHRKIRQTPKLHRYPQVVDNLWITHWAHRAREPFPKLPNSSSIGRFPRFLVWRQLLPGARAGTSRSESWLISAKIYTWRRVSELVVYESEWEREVHMDWLTLFIPIKLAVFCLLLYWAARHYFWAAARDSRHTQLQDPGKLLNSWSYDDADHWTLGV